MADITVGWIKAQFQGFATRVLEVFATKKEVKDLISGAQVSALVFDTKEALDTWMEDTENVEKLKVGQNIYIKATDTADYWWDGTELQPLETGTDEPPEDIDFSEFFAEDNT